MHTEDDVKALAEKLLEIPLTCGIERTATDIWLTREKANALARGAGGPRGVGERCIRRGPRIIRFGKSQRTSFFGKSISGM